MILRCLALKGLSVAFREEFRVDFEALGPGIICLVGPNGSGKSHLLEASGPAVLYREFISYREALADHVVTGVRDAYAELTFDLGGARYQARVHADPLFANGRGKTEAILLRDGEAIAGPSLKAFDEAVAEILPPKALFCASAFAAQGGAGSFFDMPKGQRKDLFVTMLGIEHLQGTSERARARAQMTLGALQSVRDQCASAQERAARKRSLEERRTALRPDMEEAEARLSTLRSALDAQTEVLRAVRERLIRAEAAADAITRERLRLDDAQQTIHAQTVQLAHRLTHLSAVIAQRDAIERAATELASATTDIRDLTAHEEHLWAELRPYEQQYAMIEADLKTLQEEHRRLVGERDTAVAAQERMGAYDDLLHAEAGTKTALASVMCELGTAEMRLMELEAAARDEAEMIRTREHLHERAADLSVRTELLRAIDSAHPMCAVCPLTGDARAARETLAAVEADLAALPVIAGHPEADTFGAYRDLVRRLQSTRSEHQHLLSTQQERRAAFEPDRYVASTRDGIVERITANREREETQTAVLGDNCARAAALRGQIDQLVARRRDLEGLVTTLQPMAARLPTVSAAAAQHEEASAALAEGQANLKDITHRLSLVPEPPDCVAIGADVAVAAACCERAQRAVIEQDTAVRTSADVMARLGGELAALGDPDADRARLRLQEGQLATEVADWALLERGLGRDGVQSLEIDAAGPGVTAIANDLLAHCYGPRFALAIETVASKKDGSQKEVFDVRIIDAEMGRHATRGSGGEMAILDEALRLALAIYNAQRSGYELRTLWRDETAGALSPENANRYVALLRRARVIGNFHQVLFIAHQPEVWQQADAHIWVGQGSLGAESQPEAA